MAATKLVQHTCGGALHVAISCSSSPTIKPYRVLLPFHGQQQHSHGWLSNKSYCYRCRYAASKALPSDGNNRDVSTNEDDEEGVSLGTMKLPSDTDIPRFETLLFQWANSLCQGANLPLPVPLKVDKIKGGVRLGFIIIGDEKTEVPVYIDCLVCPARADDKASRPFFRAVRNGPKRDEAPPGEPRIMRSLLQALQKSVEIARL
ncbi:hypothetical protein Scep_003361 [Stephania cephalantha]|uniref:DUF7148 domain-containing protein n=1 Tax=Stephania cephalantha TaxID=152367 RepID=A0AAP0PUB5_9MAGN